MYLIWQSLNVLIHAPENAFVPVLVIVFCIILQECVNALQKTYHPGCFTCAQCKKPIGGNQFHLEDGKAYCENGMVLFSRSYIICGLLILYRCMTVWRFTYFLSEQYSIDKILQFTWYMRFNKWSTTKRSCELCIRCSSVVHLKLLHLNLLLKPICKIKWWSMCDPLSILSQTDLPSIHDVCSYIKKEISYFDQPHLHSKWLPLQKVEISFNSETNFYLSWNHLQLEFYLVKIMIQFFKTVLLFFYSVITC